MRVKTAVSALVVGGVVVLMGPLAAVQERGGSPRPALPDLDVRAATTPSAPSPSAAAEIASSGASEKSGKARLHPHTGALRVLDMRQAPAAAGRSPQSVHAAIAALAGRLGLEREDLDALSLVRDFVTPSNGLRHVIFSQMIDGIPVFDGVVAAHLDPAGRVVRVTSSAGRGARRNGDVAVTSAEAATIAAGNIRPEQPFAALPKGGGGPQHRAQFDRGPFLRDVTAELTWLPVDGGLRLAWRVAVEPDGEPQSYDLLVDARDGAVLVRRNRVLSADGSGRVLQSNATQLLDPRRPDESPAVNGACPPASNHELRSLTLPFRDPSSVLGSTGRLAGNNVHVFVNDPQTEAEAGSFAGGQWLFDFPFESAGSAAATLFFGVNYAHDFFYDLGFTEAAGNFQQSNFGRGGLGGDSVIAVARAAGRNNATFQPMPEGSSPIISMFMWDGTGCWAQDVDGDGTQDLDGDYDLDIVLHEFHHGVSHRLNTAFTGFEADAIGEGGSDFFAYSVSGNTTLAEYSRPGGLRSINGKKYGDWLCLFGLFCEPHANGEIFANVLWDVRQRFRTDGVRGSDAAAINEVHQLYVDALVLSPPSPTMLDMRDAMVLADEVRNPASTHGENFCRIWESFAGRGMGVLATDTSDNGSGVVHANSSVPAGCTPPPPPPTVTLSVIAATANEAGPTSAAFTVSRAAPLASATTVMLSISGTARNGVDYVTLPTSVTIPEGAASTTVQVTPIDDTLLESNETLAVSLRTNAAYVIGSPSSGTMTIVSDDVAPDFVVSSLGAPAEAAAGQTLTLTDSTKNQGSGASATSSTTFYLSSNLSVDAGDTELGSRSVPPLAIGETSSGTTTVTLPAPLTAGSYYILAKADGPASATETNESNNTRSSLLKIGPDLVIATLSTPGIAGAGTAMAVTEVTKNEGAGAAAASQTQFYLSINYLLDTSDTPLASRAVGPLAPDASSSAVTSVAIPAGTATGTYYLIAKADSSDALPEATETNNVKYVTIKVGPDLQVTALSAPLTGRAGGTIAVTETSRNAGAGGASPSTTAFYLSSDYRFDATDFRLTPARAVGALAAGGSSSSVTTLTLPMVAAGRWYLLAQADDLGAVEETLETNNSRYVTIAIGPDLDLVTLTSPSAAVAGTSIAITDTVKNIGPDTAAPSTTRYYLSLDYALDDSDTVIGQRAVGALGENVSSTGTTSVVLPTGIAGKYYLIAVTDAAETVPESNEGNNTYSKLFTINP